MAVSHLCDKVFLKLDHDWRMAYYRLEVRIQDPIQAVACLEFTFKGCVFCRSPMRIQVLQLNDWPINPDSWLVRLS